MIDIYHSRRNKFKLCTYWVRDEKNSVGDLTEWVLKNKPAGQFYANEINALTLNKGQVNNVIAYDESNVALETNDQIKDIKVGCVVQYLGHLWIVVGVQSLAHNKENEFGEADRTTVLSIHR